MNLLPVIATGSYHDPKLKPLGVEFRVSRFHALVICPYGIERFMLPENLWEKRQFFILHMGRFGWLMLIWR